MRSGIGNRGRCRLPGFAVAGFQALASSARPSYKLSSEITFLRMVVWEWFPNLLHDAAASAPATSNPIPKAIARAFHTAFDPGSAGSRADRVSLSTAILARV